MAVMLRLAHVPARVVLGYAHDVPNTGGTFTVTTYDAHAWVEAYFAGVGWIPFDPTPISGISGGKTNDLAWAPHDPTQQTLPHDNTGSVAAPSITRSTRPADVPAAATSHQDNGISGVLVGFLVVLALLAMILLVPAFVRWRRRRHRLRLVRHGDTDALWDELSATATDLGYVWSPARTPRQVAAWLGGSSRSADTSLGSLTSAVEQARYAPNGTAAGPQLVRDLGEVESGLRSRRSGRERMRARFWPASLDWTRTPVVGRWLPGQTSGRRRH
jgi:hypothetical protein